MLNRVCVKDYKIPGTDKIIEKDTQIWIPIWALHRDEKYYDEPEKFNPERFKDKNLVENNLLSRPYYPFGNYFFFRLENFTYTDLNFILILLCILIFQHR